jgi:hypothetical protein
VGNQPLQAAFKISKASDIHSTFRVDESLAALKPLSGFQTLEHSATFTFGAFQIRRHRHSAALKD